ncbi:hypothetical protein GYMLUDRAFT_787891 [Collybiopsis luxurians FD-317 M1]|nr:hypothetical protein GYMLUDRAFT_787891 [Collybiopsis luxurians FD-317 M1]
MKVLLLGLLSLTSLALAVPPELLSPSRRKQAIQPPRGWTRHGLPHPDSRIELRIGLTQPHISFLEKHLLEISDPDHRRYGQHLSKAEVEALIAPLEQSVQLVDEWLQSHGINSDAISRTPAQDWAIVQVPLSQAEQMLDTIYHVWKHEDGSPIVRTTSYSLPEHLHHHIDVVHPTTTFARLSRMKSTMYRTKNKIALDETLNEGLVSDLTPSATANASCNDTVTLSCLQNLYQINGFKPQAYSKNSIAVTAYLDQFANNKDLSLFYADQRPEAINSSFDVILVNGGLNNQSLEQAGDEADLDVQFAFGLSYPTPATFYSTGGEPPFMPDKGTETNTNEPYSKWLDYVLAQDEVPFVISTSYGDYEQTVPEDYARRTCLRFLELACRGVTLTFSSGDGGVGNNDPDPQAQTCMTNDGKNQTRFLPVFPASCPYVTAVGGTRGIPEEAVSFSGENLGDNYYDLFNRSGRAYPDVSAQGLNFRVFIGGGPFLISGTSASSPTFAGIVALLNDVRLANDLPPLGFLNPLLYKKGIEALNDVTIGNNPGCGTNGFNATKGWDPVTGLGTPDFKKLRKVVLNDTEGRRIEQGLLDLAR